MSNVSSASTPREIDEHLASLHQELASLRAKQASDVNSIYHAAGARRKYQGRDLVWTMSAEEAIEEVERLAAEDETYRGRQARDLITDLNESRDEIVAKRLAIEEADQLYTGWSRFFVVTSSQGHIHSSMHCKSCYATTTFGWLPQLSGKDEAAAVEACGPALCSVCFPSAPVENQGGKISTEDAQRLANGATMAELVAEREAAKQSKLDAKAEKARKAAERARKLMVKVEAAYERLGGYDAYMALPDVRDALRATHALDLQTTVEDVIRDDWREYHGQHRYSKNPRTLIEVA